METLPRAEPGATPNWLRSDSPSPISSDVCCRKLNQRLDLMCHATSVAGGVYMYANQRGCDGGRLYYDGSACVICNGQLLAQVRCLPNHLLSCMRCMCWRFEESDPRL